MDKESPELSQISPNYINEAKSVLITSSNLLKISLGLFAISALSYVGLMGLNQFYSNATDSGLILILIFFLVTIPSALIGLVILFVGIIRARFEAKKQPLSNASNRLMNFTIIGIITIILIMLRNWVAFGRLF